MDEEAKKELQGFIDRDFELAKKSVKESAEKYGIKTDVKEKFCFFICWDLARQYGLDLKGVIPE